MANVGGPQLIFETCRLTKFAETADGGQVQFHILKYVQGACRACLPMWGKTAKNSARFSILYYRMVLFLKDLTWRLCTHGMIRFKAPPRAVSERLPLSSVETSLLTGLVGRFRQAWDISLQKQVEIDA